MHSLLFIHNTSLMANSVTWKMWKQNKQSEKCRWNTHTHTREQITKGKCGFWCAEIASELRMNGKGAEGSFIEFDGISVGLNFNLYCHRDSFVVDCVYKENRMGYPIFNINIYYAKKVFYAHRRQHNLCVQS